MSLFSYLNTDSFGSSPASPQIAKALQTIAEKTATTTSSSGSKAQSTSNSVLITLQAQRAAAEKEDAGKTADVLRTELRTQIDADNKKAGKKDSADLTAMSGRALATIALNESGQFSRTEIAAAKLEMRTRDRLTLVAQISSGPLTSSSLAAYTQQLTASRATMSAEERGLRDANPNLR